MKLEINSKVYKYLDKKREKALIQKAITFFELIEKCANLKELLDNKKKK